MINLNPTYFIITTYLSFDSMLKLFNPIILFDRELVKHFYSIFIFNASQVKQKFIITIFQKKI